MSFKPYEADFQRWVLKRLREIPRSWWLKVNDRTTVGIPDILGCVSGVFVAIELKTKSKVTPLQAYTLRKIDYAHGQSFVMNPDNCHEIFKMLEKFSSLSSRTSLELDTLQTKQLTDIEAACLQSQKRRSKAAKKIGESLFSSCAINKKIKESV